MDKRPIGVFDSGLGGISVLGELIKQLPDEEYIYFGDTANAPYGDKPPERVLELARSAVDRLLELDCKAIVIACNTATSVAASAIRQELQLPVIGMEPALKPASLIESEGEVLVLATRVTLALPKFRLLMERYGRDAVPVPCSGLMECVEAGELEGGRVNAVLSRILAPYKGRRIKAVVLGCTHYVFLRDTIARFFPEGTPLLDGNEGAARQLRRRLTECGLLSECGSGSVSFMSSSGDASALDAMRLMLELYSKDKTAVV